LRLAALALCVSPDATEESPPLELLLQHGGVGVAHQGVRLAHRRKFYRIML
jgi:hypothetical protein